MSMRRVAKVIGIGKERELKRKGKRVHPSHAKDASLFFDV